MTGLHQKDNSGINDILIETIQADINWKRNTRNNYFLILAIAGIIVITLSILLQNLYIAIIRGLIFLMALLIMYFKPESFFNYRIQFYSDGKIIVRRSFISSVIFDTSEGSITLVKKGKNWLIGTKKVKLPIDAFPNLEEKIKAIKY